MKTFLRYTGVNVGFLVGLICALISLILFSIIESVRFSLLFDGSFSFGALALVPLILIYGGIFTFFPSGFGGYVLELLIRAKLKRGPVTEKWAAIGGVLLAGLAIVITCGIGLFALAVLPHNGWQFLVNEMKDGVFFSNLPYYINGLVEQVGRLLPEIITVTILACASGGLAGKYLSRKIKASQEEFV